MTRIEALAVLGQTATRLDDEQVRALVDVAQAMAEPTVPARELSSAELAALARSKDDFRIGRVLDEQQYETEMNAFFARLRAQESHG